MAIETLVALLRPYKISKEVKETQLQRVNALNSGNSTDEKVQVLLGYVESKSGVLLTHVSMMIAITGLMLSVSKAEGLYELVLGIELVSYLLLALLCIRCQYQFDLTDFNSFPTKLNIKMTGEKKHQYAESLLGELYYRERIFRFVFKTLYILTFTLAVTVIFGLFANDSAVETPSLSQTQVVLDDEGN